MKQSGERLWSPWNDIRTTKKNLKKILIMSSWVTFDPNYWNEKQKADLFSWRTTCLLRWLFSFFLPCVPWRTGQVNAGSGPSKWADEFAALPVLHSRGNASAWGNVITKMHSLWLSYLHLRNSRKRHKSGTDTLVSLKELFRELLHDCGFN